jgi:anthranilate phosphoribosyltransferase
VDWPGVLAALVRGDDLDDATAGAAMRSIMEGEATAAQIAGFLVGLRAKGETADEIAGLVRVMREFALAVPIDADSVIDTCGTGGDRAGTFNISTVAAVVAAGAGARVAKHGNRAASSLCGSADLLEAWGVAVELGPEQVAACIDEVGIGFCFAPAYHPATRHAVPVRRELGVATVFNFLGPLTNPAGARRQTIGVADAAMAPKLADVLARLGTEHALVFCGEDGLDELTTTGPSRLWEVHSGHVDESLFDPADYGIPRARQDDLRGGAAEENRRIADQVLAGEAGPARDIVLLGAAAALVVAGRADHIGEGLEAAAAAVDSGAAATVRDRWVEVSRGQ